MELDGDTYCEGALIDTVNFESLLEDHLDLEEIWISRIVDAKQVHKPKNLHDALGSLCQLFAATVGEDDVRLFKFHVRTKKNWTGTIVEIRVSENINFEWSHSNLDRGRAGGYQAADEAVRAVRTRRLRFVGQLKPASKFRGRATVPPPGQGPGHGAAKMATKKISARSDQRIGLTVPGFRRRRATYHRGEDRIGGPRHS